MATDTAPVNVDWIPLLTLPRVPDFDLEASMSAGEWPPTRGVPVVLQQLWRPMPDRGFQPGTVWHSATNEALLVFAELQGCAARTTASADHQQLWEQGDVFEIFIQALGADGYFQFQIAPNGYRLQLHYPAVGAGRQEGIERYVHRESLFALAQQHAPARERWRLAVQIPARALLLARPALAGGAEWRLACCRYHYAADGSFSLSSTAPLSRPDFHRIGEWPRLAVPGGFAA